MDSKAWEALASKSWEEIRVLTRTAREAKISVEELVNAGLGRYPAQVRAHEAAQALKARRPAIFEGIDAWPQLCALCRATMTAPVQCAHCRTRGCASCVKGAGCIACPPNLTIASILDLPKKVWTSKLEPQQRHLKAKTEKDDG